MRYTSFTLFGILGVAGLSALADAQTTSPTTVQLPAGFVKPQPTQKPDGSNISAFKEKASQIEAQGGVPAHEPIVVTPQMQSAISNLNFKQNAVAAIDQKYKSAVNDVTAKLTEKGDSLIVVSPRTTDPEFHSFSYYIVSPDGSQVDVSSSDYNGWTYDGTGVQKTVTVYDSQNNPVASVQIVIEHPDAKAAVYAKSDVPLDAQVIEKAFNIAFNRGNVYIIVPPPMAY